MSYALLYTGMDPESTVYIRLRIIYITILPCMYPSEMLLYARVTRIPRLLGLKNYLNNYFAMYIRLMRSRMRV